MESSPLTVDEWRRALSAQAHRCRVAMSIAGLEQNVLEQRIREATESGVMTPTEIQYLLLQARGGDDGGTLDTR